MPDQKRSLAGTGAGIAAGATAAQSGRRPFNHPGKDSGLVLLGDAPLVAETPESLLDDDTTPVSRFFVRNNGLAPPETQDPAQWSIAIEGEIERPLILTLQDLKSQFTARRLRMVLECGGNGRAFFSPPARGNPWTNGGVGCAEWTGVPLADVLNAAGLRREAQFTGHYGADYPLSGGRSLQAISRGMPIAKALEPHTLIAWDMNGAPLSHLHGGPVRLIVPGWPGSLSQKWLTKILLRRDPHDGPGMGGTSYRVPTVPLVPGAEADGKTNFRDFESMPLRAIITSPADCAQFPAGLRTLPLRGAAWAGDHRVSHVDVSANAGQTWVRMDLAEPRNRYDWQRWSGTLPLPGNGYCEIWVRATDERGVMQPHVATNWNPQGYGANPMHRIAIMIG